MVLELIHKIKNKFFKISGQIKENSQIGAWIVESCNDKKNKIFFEIGTYNGLGSTSIFIKYLNNRQDQVIFYSLEANEDLHKQAKKNLDFKINFGKNFLILYGKLVRNSDLDKIDLNLEEKNWLTSDIEIIEKAPDLRHIVPKKIDVLLLDGGEFSSTAELNFLWNHLNENATILLDDIFLRKNKKNLETIKKIKPYAKINISRERNGTALIIL